MKRPKSHRPPKPLRLKNKPTKRTQCKLILMLIPTQWILTLIQMPTQTQTRTQYQWTALLRPETQQLVHLKEVKQERKQSVNNRHQRMIQTLYQWKEHHLLHSLSPHTLSDEKHSISVVCQNPNKDGPANFATKQRFFGRICPLILRMRVSRHTDELSGHKTCVRAFGRVGSVPLSPFLESNFALSNPNLLLLHHQKVPVVPITLQILHLLENLAFSASR